MKLSRVFTLVLLGLNLGSAIAIKNCIENPVIARLPTAIAGLLTGAVIYILFNWEHKNEGRDDSKA